MNQKAIGLSNSGENVKFVRRLSEDLKTHFSFGDKFTGGKGEKATAEWIDGRLKELGFVLSRQRFDWPFFVPRKAVLETGSNDLEIIPQVVVVPTGPNGVKAKLAIVHNEYDIERACGRIALIIAPHKRHASLLQAPIGPLVKASAKAGAKAVIIITNGPSGEAIALNTSGKLPFVPIPTAVMSPKYKDLIFKAAKKELPATLVIDGINELNYSENIMGTIERGKRWLVISTPRTGFFNCAGERGTGTAAFLALAEWAVSRFPEISLFLLNTSAHEYGGIGTKHAFGLAPPPDKTALWAHIGATLAAYDAIEFRDTLTILPSSDAMRILMVTDSLYPIVKDTFKGVTGLECPQMIIPGAGELPEIVKQGYSHAFGALGIHRWFHTRSDTLDKVDARLLLPVINAHKRTIESVLLI